MNFYKYLNYNKIWVCIMLIICTFLVLSSVFYFNSRVTLNEKIGQMILVGFRGYDAPEYIKNAIANRQISGVILFDYDVIKNKPERNIKSPSQLKKLVSKLKSCSSYPIFVAIDQEGGKITRLNSEKGFPDTLSAKALGDANNLDSTYKNSEIIAKNLQSLGINLNFAPVVDLNINPDNPAIGKKERSYSANLDIVVNHARQVILAHKKYNILTAIKHFPGHGSSKSDSHEGFVDASDVWQKIELVPYRKLIKEGNVDIVMIAHIFNKHFDKDFPATLSKNTLNILRNDMDFDGVIISDDLQMKAIASRYALKELVLKMLNAGIDIFLVCNNLDYDENIHIKIKNIILEGIKDGEINRKRIDESYERIKKLKNRLK